MFSQGKGTFVVDAPCLKYHFQNKLTGLKRVYVEIGSLVCIINLLITPIANVKMRWVTHSRFDKLVLRRTQYLHKFDA